MSEIIWLMEGRVVFLVTLVTRQKQKMDGWISSNSYDVVCVAMTTALVSK